MYNLICSAGSKKFEGWQAPVHITMPHRMNNSEVSGIRNSQMKKQKYHWHSTIISPTVGKFR